ncbi:hypothetical protein [Paracoccus sp. S1E-3]|uniref:hypothetical protein n=1 Tax=Paracoccus sp. S1E-3 TaxID=2756130 RepID=UPI0015EF5FAA|nr:hypothetical protein [Paracoccus sp. S1E-3]MBA4491408.1 hypothetical protein [Paracoccus sp. S1E-3]
MRYKAKEVFVAGGMPTITYVGRADLSLEKDLRSELREGYKVISVTGPTKSGKTVLTRHVLGRDKSITVNGGQVKDSAELWSDLLGKLSLPSEIETSRDKKYSAGLRWIISAQRQVANGEKQKFTQAHKTNILEYMRLSDLTLVVDDFHYMNTDLQRDVIRTLKSEVFDGLTAVLIAVPHRAFDAIGVEREMEGRFAHIEIPVWDEKELIEISKAGFPKLNMNVKSGAIDRFARESHGSPLLMQRFCSRLCAHYEIGESLPKLREYNPSEKTLEDIFVSVAEQFGLPTFQKLSRGPQSRSKRIDRELRDGSGTLDRYEAVLRAIAMTGPKEKVHYDEIRDKLKLLLDEGSVPQKHEVSAALGHMTGIARDQIAGEPVLEWADDYLYLTDPFLIFYMRWTQQAS